MRDSDNLSGLSVDDIAAVKIEDACPECGTHDSIIGDRVGRRVLLTCRNCEYSGGIGLLTGLESEYNQFIVYEEGESTPW